MKAVIKQDFDYSADGLRAIRLKAGEVHEISDSLVSGLSDAGLIEPAAPAVQTVEPVEKVADAQPVVAPRAESAPARHTSVHGKRRHQ